MHPKNRVNLKRSFSAALGLKRTSNRRAVSCGDATSTAAVYFHYRYSLSDSVPLAPRSSSCRAMDKATAAGSFGSVVERQQTLACPWCDDFSLGCIRLRSGGNKRRRGDRDASSVEAGETEEKPSEDMEIHADCTRWTRSTALAVAVLSRHITLCHGAPWLEVLFAVDETSSLHICFTPKAGQSAEYAPTGGNYGSTARDKEFSWCVDARGKGPFGLRYPSLLRRTTLHHIVVSPPLTAEAQAEAKRAAAAARNAPPRLFYPQSGVPVTLQQREALAGPPVLPNHQRPTTGTGKDVSTFIYPSCRPSGSLADIRPTEVSIPSGLGSFNTSFSAVLTRSELGLDEYTDLTVEERQFFKLWNRHVYIQSCTRFLEAGQDGVKGPGMIGTAPGVVPVPVAPVPLLDDHSCTFSQYGDSFVPWSCEVFVKTYCEELVRADCRFLLLAHLLNLTDFCLLSPADLKKLMLYYDEYAATKLNSSRVTAAGGSGRRKKGLVGNVMTPRSLQQQAVEAVVALDGETAEFMDV